MKIWTSLMASCIFIWGMFINVHLIDFSSKLRFFLPGAILVLSEEVKEMQALPNCYWPASFALQLATIVHQGEEIGHFDKYQPCNVHIHRIGCTLLCYISLSSGLWNIAYERPFKCLDLQQKALAGLRHFLRNQILRIFLESVQKQGEQQNPLW